MIGQLFDVETPFGKYQFSTGSGEFHDAADKPADAACVLKQAPPGASTVLADLLSMAIGLRD